MGGLAGIQREVFAEWAGDDSNSIPELEPPRLRKLNQTVALASSNFADDAVGDARGCYAIHDQIEDTRAPAGAVPLQDDDNEGVTRKQRRTHLDAPAV